MSSNYVTQRQLNELADVTVAGLGAIRDELAGTSSSRTASKAHLLGPRSHSPLESGDAANFFAAVAAARSRDAVEQAEGKEILESLGSRYSESAAKATLGTTDASGGYIIPRNLVANLVEQAGVENPMRRILTVISDVRAGAVDIPQQPVANSRAVIAAWGATKENANLTVASYTATLYTLAKIYDVGNQLLRHSSGAAEQLVRSALAKSFAAGEAYYIINGSGSSEPKGLLTSLAAAPAAMTTAHTASDSTVAGSVRAAVAKAIEALAGRNFDASAILVNPGDVAHALVQGADTAGYYVQDDGLTRLLGLPIVVTTAIASKTAIVGDFKAATLFVGDEYRVDVSTEAGDRWDKNLTGFRAEEEIGFNADSPVLVGAFQRITGLIP